MNKSLIVLAAALGVGAVITMAQDANGGRRGGPGGPGGRPMPAIINALDANKDGKLDATEIANAATALKSLDKNGDGEITTEEMFGPRPAGGAGGGAGRETRPPQQ